MEEHEGDDDVAHHWEHYAAVVVEAQNVQNQYSAAYADTEHFHHLEQDLMTESTRKKQQAC